MSRSTLIKLIILAAVFFMPVKFASAATLAHESDSWEVSPAFSIVLNNPSIRNDLDLDKLTKNTVLGTHIQTTDKIYDPASADVINQIAAKLDQSATDPKLVIEDHVAKEFNPGQNGQGLDVYDLRAQLQSGQTNITLPIVASVATNTLANTNNLGINELVAVGESDFKGSPNNRIHNITVGAAKYNGLIIDQGQEFSFNQYLGDVDAEHGFLPELVIKATGTVPEFGGGLCQVSSTTFRAAMNAGLPITARRNHSYAVQYYAPQGTDATIYPGVQDLKFVNNLSSPILVRTRIDGTKLYFEFYGTKDSRSVAFDGPVQYDRQTSGAMKATWTRHVTMNGETTTQTFDSIYQSPALFHKEEQKSTPNPDTVATANNQPVISGAETH